MMYLQKGRRQESAVTVIHSSQLSMLCSSTHDPVKVSEAIGENYQGRFDITPTIDRSRKRKTPRHEDIRTV
jgi:hypothetical protein